MVQIVLIRRSHRCYENGPLTAHRVASTHALEAPLRTSSIFLCVVPFNLQRCSCLPSLPVHILPLLLLTSLITGSSPNISTCCHSTSSVLSSPSCLNSTRGSSLRIKIGRVQLVDISHVLGGVYPIKCVNIRVERGVQPVVVDMWT